MTFAPSYDCPMIEILSNLVVFKNSTNFKTKAYAVCFSDKKFFYNVLNKKLKIMSFFLLNKLLLVVDIITATSPQIHNS
jgi:hypothetical protein